MITDGQGKIEQTEELKKILKQRVRVEFTERNYHGVDGEPMQCPKGCGSNSHLQHVTFVSDYDNRRESVKLHFQGECGHIWNVYYRQHEGQTFVEYSSALVDLGEPLFIGLRDE